MSIRAKMMEITMKKGQRESSKSYPGTLTFMPISPPIVEGGMKTMVINDKRSIILLSRSVVRFNSMSMFCEYFSMAMSMLAKARSMLNRISFTRDFKNLIRKKVVCDRAPLVAKRLNYFKNTVFSLISDETLKANSLAI